MSIYDATHHFIPKLPSLIFSGGVCVGWGEGGAFSQGRGISQGATSLHRCRRGESNVNQEISGITCRVPVG